LTWFSYGPILEASPARGNDDDEALVDRCPAQFCPRGRLFLEQRQQRGATRTCGRTTCRAGARARTTGGSTGRACTRDPGSCAAARACTRASASAAQLGILKCFLSAGACASSGCAG